MGRPSKLTDAQWEQIGKRLLEGEKAAALAREFKVSPATISERFSKSTEKVKAVANQIVTTGKALDSLSVAEQVSAISLAGKLRSTLEHLSSAAEYGAATAHKFMAMANTQALKVDEVDPMKSLDVLKGIGVLTKLGNDSSELAKSLVNGSKDAVKQIQTLEADPVTPVKITIQVEDASIPEPEAQ